ncbi:hypothetical protein NHX12_033139, partial [Muraenolepis orangiensis]
VQYGPECDVNCVRSGGSLQVQYGPECDVNCVRSGGSLQVQYGPECEFREKLLANHYNAYESAAYPGMYIGLGRTGRTKRGNRVTPTMTVTHFLPRL